MNAAIWSPCDPPIERDILAEREDEQIEIEVQSRILHTDDSDLANIALAEESPLCVDEAARRILGRIIRAALRRSSATLTDDERVVTAFVRECIEAEVRR